MDRLTPELYRVLNKRITTALTKAKYSPETVADWSGPALVAREVLRPYAPRKLGDDDETNSPAG